MIPLSFVQCEQIKFRPNKKVKIKISHSVVAVGTVGVGMNFCNQILRYARPAQPGPIQ